MIPGMFTKEANKYELSFIVKELSKVEIWSIKNLMKFLGLHVPLDERKFVRLCENLKLFSRRFRRILDFDRRIIFNEQFSSLQISTLHVRKNAQLEGSKAARCLMRRILFSHRCSNESVLFDL